MKCLVTGATGHIGNVLVRELLEHCYDVSVFVLPTDDLSIFEDLNVKIITGDICNSEDVEAAVLASDIIFHLAGIIDIGSASKKRMQEVNVGGMQNIINACKKYPGKRLIYTSSVHAIPELPKHTVMEEMRDFSPDFVEGAYAKTKAEATRAILDYSKEGGDVIIVHPSGVIGPYEYHLSNMGQMILDCINGELKVYIDGAYNFVDVRDVAQGIRLACENGIKGECYILSGEIIEVKKIFDIIADFCQHKHVRFKMPYFFAAATAYFAEYYYKILHKKPVFTRYSIKTLRTNCNYSNEKARTILGFSPRPIKESIEDTVKWLIKHYNISR